MAPEAFQEGQAAYKGRRTDCNPAIKFGRPSDVWALGCILYQVCSHACMCLCLCVCVCLCVYEESAVCGPMNLVYVACMRMHVRRYRTERYSSKRSMFVYVCANYYILHTSVYVWITDGLWETGHVNA